MMAMRHDADGDTSRALIRAADGNYYGTVRRRVVVAGLHLSEMTYDDGARIPSHQHECPSLFMPLCGAFVEGCTGTVRSYAPGDVSYHPPYEPHWLDTRGVATGTSTRTSARGFAIEIGAAWCASLGAETRWDGIPRDLSLANASWAMGRL
jgi:hypothetical protein